MTRIRVQLQLPEDLAEDAKREGLLSPQALSELLQDEMRRRAGVKLLQMTEKIASQPGEPMTLEEIQKIVKSVRRQRRESHAARS